MQDARDGDESQSRRWTGPPLAGAGSRNSLREMLRPERRLTADKGGDAFGLVTDRRIRAAKRSAPSALPRYSSWHQPRYAVGSASDRRLRREPVHRLIVPDHPHSGSIQDFGGSLAYL